MLGESAVTLPTPGEWVGVGGVSHGLCFTWVRTQVVRLVRTTHERPTSGQTTPPNVSGTNLPRATIRLQVTTPYLSADHASERGCDGHQRHTRGP